MRKTAAMVDPNPATAPRPRPGMARLAWLAGAALAAPLAFDALRLVVARWRAMLGPSRPVETPALDLAGRFVGDAWHVGSGFLTSWTHHVPWPVDYAAAGLIACALIGAAFLRRGRW